MYVTRRRFITAISLAAAALTLPPKSLSAGIEAGGESRAIFDEGLNWASWGSAETVCERVARAGFNVLIPCVWHGRGTIWPSNLAPWDNTAAKSPGFDPLAHLIRVARQFDIEVHPWFTVARRDRDFFPQFYDSASIPETFDVHRPDFRSFIVSLILEVVERYAVQGINLDYIRTGGICTSPYCINQYRRDTGRNLLDDVAGKYPAEFLAWQDRAVEDIVRRVSDGARRLRPGVVISVDAVPGHPVDTTQGRNSLRWADTGLVDVVYMMHYESSPDWIALERLQAPMVRPEALVVLCGNFEEIGTMPHTVIPRQARRVAELLDRARRFQRGNGVGLYLYSRLSDEQIDELGAGTFGARTRAWWKRGAAMRRPEGISVS